MGGNWQAIMMQFPEINLWRDLREKLRLRVWAPDPEGTVIPEEDKNAEKKRSKWDEKAEQQPCLWARQWRKKLKLILPRGTDEAVAPTDPEVMQLANAIWKDVIEWAKTDPELARPLELFTAEPSGRTYVATGIEPSNGDQALQWAFVPATDLFLVIGEGVVGLTAEGIFSENPVGHERLTFQEVMDGLEKKKKEKKKEDRDRDRDRNRSRDRRDR